MSDQKPFVVEDHHTWALLSDGNVITMGHPMFGKYPGQTSQPPKQPAGPRKVLRSEFDEMDHPERHKLVKEMRDGGVLLVDSLEPKKPAPVPRQPPTISRATFDKMSPAEQFAIVADINRGDAQLVD